MNKQITVFGLCYNEELMLPFFIAHYRKMFPGCRIVLWDNESTDRTHDIAIANKCEIKTYNTDGKLNDVKYLEIKNNWWKEAETDWVLVADIDEHLYITEGLLSVQDFSGSSIIRSKGFNMVNLNDDLNISSIDHGVRSKSYDKSYCFKRSVIQEINYGPGCHGSNPKGLVNYSIEDYVCMHYKYVNPDYMVKRHSEYASRLSNVNKAKGYGSHYLYSDEKIRSEFNEARKNAIKII